ncbi:hypothetical protein GE09DRAFT_1092466 [Coniochaeta sp. 2T2.1]|nr:hypothetical protein GE09DRAFT_1092466 [Coniochaeta sp. 2T2.1]
MQAGVVMGALGWLSFGTLTRHSRSALCKRIAYVMIPASWLPVTGAWSLASRDHHRGPLSGWLMRCFRTSWSSWNRPVMAG